MTSLINPVKEIKLIETGSSLHKVVDSISTELQASDSLTDRIYDRSPRL